MNFDHGKIDMGDVRHEPSMEEILSSIKRIIAEDSEAMLSTVRQRRVARPAAPQPGDEDEPEDVLELTAPQEIAPSAQDPQPEPKPHTQPEPAAVRPEASQPQPASGAPSAAAAKTPAEALVSSGAAEASRQALASLSALVVKPAPNSDNTLEALVREMLRPMLKEWLDAHLPELVEALVAREIARLTSQSL